MEMRNSDQGNQERDWSSLPDLVILSIARRLESMVDSFSLRSVCTNWRSVATPSPDTFSSQSPLILVELQNTDTQHLFDISQNRVYKSWFPWQLESHYAVSFSQGYLVTLSQHDAGDVRLYNVFSRSQIELPLVPNPNNEDSHYSHGILSEPLCSPHSSLIVFDQGTCNVACYNFGNAMWCVNHEEDSEDLEDSKNFVQDMIMFRGKLYALMMNASLVTVDFVPDMQISYVGLAINDGMSELIENKGESMIDWTLAKTDKQLLLVCLTRNSSELFIYYWDFEIKRPVEAKTIDGKALFLSRMGFGACVEPNRLTVRENCIYFVDEYNNKWLEFSLIDGRRKILGTTEDVVLREAGILVGRVSSSFWVLPNMFDFN